MHRKQKRHILMLNFEYPPVGGGAATATYHLLREFAGQEGVRVALVTSSAGNRREIYRQAPNITIIRLRVGKKDLHFWRIPEICSWSWQAYWLCRRMLRKREYHLCHCWFGWPAGLIGYLLRGKVPYIVSLRGSDVPGYNQRLALLDRFFFPWLSRRIWGQARMVTANSMQLKRLSENTSRACPVQVIGNGVDVHRFRPSRGHKRRVGLRLLFVGRLISRKGVKFLLEAVRDLVEENSGNPGLLHIAGDGPEARRLRQFCLAHRLEQHVRFLGNVPRERIAVLYRKADVLVLPSLQESHANVVLEAMASGLPIITTKTGAAELLDGNGFVVPAMSSSALKEAITAYLADPALLTLHGRQSRRLAERMSWAAAAKTYLHLYAEHGKPLLSLLASERVKPNKARDVYSSSD
ncbi:MAG: glycosyltransferase family 4 protein [Desulfobacteraceae bacterium]|nr:glycosyltransferase family 4 protein [Desulfobacteraceae bacterium]